MWRRAGIILLVIIIGGSVGLFVVFRSWQKQGRVTEVLTRAATSKLVSSVKERGIAETILGFEKPQTYLVLFLNNTELRPGGGFIGAYGIVTFNKGSVSIEKIEGTERLGGYLVTSTAPAVWRRLTFSKSRMARASKS